MDALFVKILGFGSKIVVDCFFRCSVELNFFVCENFLGLEISGNQMVLNPENVVDEARIPN